MEKIFYTDKNAFPSTDEALKTVFKRFFEIHDACIIRGDNGKPYLKSSPLFFSVSHTEDKLFIAVSDRNVGIDAERENRSVFYPPIIKKFSTSEREEIESNEDFLLHWTAKECAVKWLGGSLSQDLFKLQYVNGRLLYKEIDLPVKLCFLRFNDCVVAVCGENDFSKVERIAF